MKSIFIVILIALICAPICTAQIDFKKIAPPNPNVASIMKAALTPVTEYAGTASIDIPLYTANVDNVSVPISLSYHTGGIQVAEESGVVGLGWALNAGGVIARNKMGMDDFANNLFAYLKHNKQHPNLPVSFLGYYDPDNDRFIESDNQGRFMVGTELTNFVFPVPGSTTTDFMPDVFTFSFNGYSGSFVLKRDGTVFLLEKKGIKVTHDYNGDPMNVNFTVITEDGTTYAFREKEVSQTLYENHTQYISSWYLSEITTINGELITFYYDNHKGRSLPLKTFIQNYQGNDHFHCNAGLNNSFESYAAPQSQIDDIYMDSIDFPTGKVKFDYSDQGERLDLSKAHYLKSIEVANLNAKPIKRHDFEYTYFGSANNGDPSLENGDYGNYSANFAEGHVLNRRLRLDAVVEDNLKTHSFEYFGSAIVPNKTDMGQDYWGFYNGELNAHSFIPYPANVPIKAKRQPVLSKARIFGLKKITYPTDGFTEFDYELNTFSGFHQLEEQLPATVPKFSDRAFVDAGEEMENSILLNPKPAANTPVELIANITVYDNHTPSLTKEQLENAFDFERDIEVAIIKTTGGVPERTRVDFNEEELKAIFTNDNSFGLVTASVTQGYPIYDVNSTYTLEVFFDSHFDSRFEKPENTSGYGGAVELSVKWLDLEQSKTEHYSFGGGLRIKSIEDHDHTGELLRKRNFNYHYKDTIAGVEIEKSYGKIKTLPNFDVDKTTLWGIPNSRGDLCMTPLIVANATSHNSYSKDMGSYVGYNQVEVTQMDRPEEDNGKTVSKFHNFQDLFGYISLVEDKDDYYEYPPIRLPHNGLLYEQEHYKRVSGEVMVDRYDLVRRIEKGYEVNGKSTFNFDLEDLYRNTDFTISANLEFIKIRWEDVFTPRDLRFQFRPYYSNSVHQVSEKETVYDQNGQNGVASEQKLNYSPGPHYQLTRTESLDSQGNTVVSELFYPDDVAGENGLNGGPLTPSAYAAIAKMKYNGQHSRVGQAIQTITTNNGETTIERTNFEEWSPGIILTDMVQTSKGTTALEDRMLYHGYDNRGKPLEVSRPNGTSISYIWGYNGQYPIAKIENATSADVEDYVVNLKKKSDNDDDRTVDIVTANGKTYIGNEGLLRRDQDALRAAFPLAMVTTYTYDPLIGVTSMTDSNGYTTYYEYDAFNRLEGVKDADNNRVTDYKYHYKGR